MVQRRTVPCTLAATPAPAGLPMNLDARTSTFPPKCPVNPCAPSLPPGSRPDNEPHNGMPNQTRRPRGR